EAARSHIDEGMKIAREIGDKRWEMQALDVMGRIATRDDRFDDARRLLRAAHVLAGDLRDRKLSVDIARHFGEMLRASGEGEEAYAILGFAHREYMSLGLPAAAEVASELSSLRPEIGDAAARLDESVSQVSA